MTRSMARNDRVTRLILLVGGGRWARVHAGVLASLLSPEQKVVWYTKHSVPQVEQCIVQLGEAKRFSVISDWHEALRSSDAAIVAARSKSHAIIALELLSQRIPVLVEKPMALDVRAADNNVSTAL